VLDPEDVSPNEMAEILSNVLGRSIRYEQTPIIGWRQFRRRQLASTS